MRERQALLASARPIRPDYVARLKAIVARAGSATSAKGHLGTSMEVLEGALSGGKFRPSTIARLEAAIDRVDPQATEASS